MTAQALQATPPAPASAAHERERLPLLAKLALLAIMLPLYFEVGGLLLSPSRILFLGCVPILLVRLLGGRYGGVLPVDLMILGFVFWMALSVSVNNPEVLVTFVGSNALILLGGYLIARSQIRTPGQFEAFVRLLGLLVAGALPFAIYEAVTGQLSLGRLFEALPVVHSHPDVNYERRMSFDRVQFVFAHPIHYGLFCSLAFSMVLIGLRGSVGGALRLPWALAIGFTCFLSVSSGPFLSLLVQFALIAYAVAMRNLPSRWTVLASSGALIYLVLDLISDRPAIYVILTKIAFNSFTANVRRVLLEYGLAQIARTPVLGVGFNGWDLPRWMTGSTDNYWLMLALLYGVPAFACLFGALVWTLWKAGRQPFAPGSRPDMLRLGYGIVMVSLTLTLATVAVWGEMSSMTFLMLGAGAWFATYRPDDEEPGVAVADALPARARRLSRFPRVEAGTSVAARAALARGLPPRWRSERGGEPKGDGPGRRKSAGTPVYHRDIREGGRRGRPGRR